MFYTLNWYKKIRKLLEFYFFKSNFTINISIIILINVVYGNNNIKLIPKGVNTIKNKMWRTNKKVLKKNA